VNFDFLIADKPKAGILTTCDN